MAARAARSEASTTPTPPSRPSARTFTALASWVRVRMMDLLATNEMTIPELAKELELHRATVRYHLTFLLDKELVEPVGPSTHGGAGRPAMRYRASRHAQLPTYPSRQFELLAQVALRTLAEEFGKERSVDALRAKGVEIGRAMVKQAAQDAAIDRWTPELFQRLFIEGRMRAFGIPSRVLSRSTSHIHFRCFSCPFLEVAESMTDLVCNALDLGFHEGIDSGLGGAVVTERRACMGHGDPYCEYRMTWGKGKREKRRRSSRGR